MKGDIIYLLSDDGPVEMRASLFDSEDDLQDLVAPYPSLLGGAQMTPGDPRRWLLVQREMGVPIQAGGSDNFSADHLFVDHEAVPTVREVDDVWVLGDVTERALLATRGMAALFETRPPRTQRGKRRWNEAFESPSVIG